MALFQKRAAFLKKSGSLISSHHPVCCATGQNYFALEKSSEPVIFKTAGYLFIANLMRMIKAMLYNFRDCFQDLNLPFGLSFNAKIDHPTYLSHAVEASLSKLTQKLKMPLPVCFAAK